MVWAHQNNTNNRRKYVTDDNNKGNTNTSIASLFFNTYLHARVDVRMGFNDGVVRRLVALNVGVDDSHAKA